MLAVLIVVFLMLQPQNGIWVALNMIYPKLYPNSLLVSLNARTRLRDDVAGVQLTQTYEVSVQPAHSGSGGGSGRMGQTVRLHPALGDTLRAENAYSPTSSSLACSH
jgi:hypothetical protein